MSSNVNPFSISQATLQKIETFQGIVCMILWGKRPKNVRKNTPFRIGGRLKIGPSIRGAMWQPPTRSLSPDLVYVRSQGMGLGQLDNTFTKQ